MTKNKLLKNISWLFFDKILRVFGGLLVGIWVARYLGPNDFGILNYSLAYTALFVIFVRLGLDEIVIREIVKDDKSTSCLLGTSFTLKSIGALIAIISIYISFFFIDTDRLTKTIIFSLSIGFIFQSIDVIDFYYKSQVLSKFVVLARNSAFIISSLLKVYFIIYEFDVIYFAVSNIIDLFLAAMFLIIIYEKNGNSIRQWRFSSQIALQLLKYSWPLAISIFLISIHIKIDQVMIGNMLNAEQVGIYSVAVRLAEFWYFIPGVFLSTFMPYFVNLRETNKELYHYRLMQLYSLMFWMGAIVGILIVIFGEAIIKLLFGEAYISGYEALVFNIWNGIFVSQAIARGIWMISENLQKYRLYNNVLAVTVNIIANLILIPKIGIAGAAIATLLTQFFGTWVFSFLWRPLRASTLAMLKSINPIYIIRL